MSTEQLQALEQELKRLYSLDDAELDAAIKQLGLPEQSTEGNQRGSFVGTLFSIERACKLLRGRINIPLSVATQVQITATLSDMAENLISHSEDTQIYTRPLE